MMNSVPFMTVEDEPRIIKLVKGICPDNFLYVQIPFKTFLFVFLLFIEWIAKKEVPEFKLFTEEPKAKRNRRHKKYAKEAVESEVIKKDLEKKSEVSGNLEQQIMKRQTEREKSSNNFFDRLLEKYGGADDSEEYVFPANKKKSTAKKTNSKEPIRKVKSGRVSKK